MREKTSSLDRVHVIQRVGVSSEERLAATPVWNSTCKMIEYCGTPHLEGEK